MAVAPRTFFRETPKKVVRNSNASSTPHSESSIYPGTAHISNPALSLMYADAIFNEQPSTGSLHNNEYQAGHQS